MTAQTKLKNLNKYLKPKEEKILVQAKINKSLHDKVFEILQKEDRSLNEIVNALLQRFVDETK